jgi:hypothetical protein
MEPTKELIDALYIEDIRDARRMTVAQRLRAGGDLFDSACAVTLSGIRGQNPGISDADAMRELRRRVELGRQLETRR